MDAKTRKEAEESLRMGKEFLENARKFPRSYHPAQVDCMEATVKALEKALSLIN